MGMKKGRAAELDGFNWFGVFGLWVNGFSFYLFPRKGYVEEGITKI